MIRSWADLEAFLASGGRLRFDPRGDGDSWSDAATGADIRPVLATRALADQIVEAVGRDGAAVIYARKEAA